MSAVGQHHHVRAQVEDGLGSAAVPSAVDAQARQLQLVPTVMPTIWSRLGALAAVVIWPAELLLLLEQGHVIGHARPPRGPLPSAGPPPTTTHLPRSGGLLDDVRHAHEFAGGRGVLDAQHVQALVHGGRCSEVGADTA